MLKNFVNERKIATFAYYKNTNMKKYLLALATILVGAISSNAQLVNPGFETWSPDPLNSSALDPNSGGSTSMGWQCFNLLSSSFLGSSPISVFQSTNAHGGTYSAKIVTVKLTTTSYGYVSSYGVPDTMGMVLTGTFSGTSIKVGIPFTQRIAQFQFYYEYAPNGTDTASCSVVLSHFSGGKRNTLGAGIFKTPATASAWTQGTVNIYWDSLSGNPDTITVVFSSSSLSPGGKPKLGSTLYVDDASVVTGINELNAPSTNVNVYPNPASDNVYFNISGNDMGSYVNVYDMTGKQINSYAIRNNRANISTQYYNAGLYFYQIYDKSGSLMKTGKFSIVR